MSSKVDAGFEIKDPDPEILPVLPSSHRDGGIRREIDNNDNCDEKPTISAPELKPVPFMSLFRFATKLEVALNAVGLVAAAASGSALPLMSLLFGNLVQAFVTFGTVLALAQMGDTNAQEELPIAAARFRHVSALDASYLVYMGLGSFVCTFLYMYTWSYTGEVNAMRLRERYLEAILRQDIAYFDNVGAGEVTTRIRTDTHLVQQGTSEKVALSASFVSSFFTGMILAYIRSWRLALALSSMIPAIAIAGAFMNYFISRYKQISLKYSAAAGSIAEEVISTVRTAHAFGTQETLADVYDGPIDKSRAISLKSAIWQGGGMAVLLFVIYSGYALAFSFGTTLINKGEITPGAVVNVFDAILVGSFSLALLAPELQAITHAQGAAAKLYETIDRVPIIDSYSEAGLKPDTCVGEITLEDIQFNYPSRPDVPILNHLSITFPAGTTVALVGASGSGKSTVISLVERFYDPLAGAIKLDGIDLRELNIRWLRSQIGLVSQEPTLFSTTVKDNVAYGLIGTKWEQASDDKKMTLIKEACVKANADTFISKLPLGYDSLVGERGLQLSGGQKQRIAIARAIVSDPRILLLDEATSALDTQSEDVVQDALDKAAAGRTTITIAHRLSTIKDADCIYVMGDGQVLESGTHRQLLLDETGPYSLLVEAQKLRETDTEQADTMETTDSIRNPEDIASEGFADEPKGETPPGCIPTNHPLGSKLRPRWEDSSLKPQYSLPYLFKRMGAINRDNWLRYLIGGVAACLNGAVYPAFGIVFGNSINSFSEPDPRQRRHDGDRNALWLFLIGILATAVGGCMNSFFGKSASDLTAKLCKLSFRAILRQDIAFFDKDENSAGALTSSLSDKPEKIEVLAGAMLGAIIQGTATLVVGLAIGLGFGWKLGLVAVACIPFLISAGYIRLRIVVLKDQKNKKSHDSSAQLACEAAGAIRTVASLTRERDCLTTYSKSLGEPVKNSIRTALWSNLLFALSQCMVFYVIALIFWYGSRLVASQEYTPFQFFVVLMSTTFAAIQIGNGLMYVPDMSSATAAASDIIDLLDSKPEIDAQSKSGRIPENLRGRVRFENVQFCYPTRPGVRVLRKLDLTVEPGTYVALVGESGCGKSTIIQLIERFYDPSDGSIYLDEQPISELTVSEYRKHISLVSQEPTLYAGTIRFNVLLGAAKPSWQVTQEEIEEACRNANILDFINLLPDGFETQVGGKGSQLSGGQKQRIAIARALIRNPKVLLLDEATSALDSTSEKVVQSALDQAAKGRTTIAIAHRLSTTQNADRIFFIQGGAVSEAGTHEELLAMRGNYSKYVRLQDLSRK